MDEAKYIVSMEKTLADLQVILDGLAAQVNENIEYNDAASAFSALRKYREFVVRYVNADCDLSLVKITQELCRRNA
jgi:hypothetical protein